MGTVSRLKWLVAGSLLLLVGGLPPSRAATSIFTVETAKPRIIQIWPEVTRAVASGSVLAAAGAHDDDELFAFGAHAREVDDPLTARVYLHFPLDVFQPGTRVRRAQLFVHADYASGSGPASIGVFRVLDPWTAGEEWGAEPEAWPALLQRPIAVLKDEVSVSANVLDETARAAASSPHMLAAYIAGPQSPVAQDESPVATPNQSPLPTGTAAAVAPTPAVATATPAEQDLEAPVILAEMPTRLLRWDVTALVRGWIAGEAADRGLCLASMIDADEEYDDGSTLIMAWRGGQDSAARRPYLVAEFDVVTVTPALAEREVLPVAGKRLGDRSWIGGLVLTVCGVVLLASCLVRLRLR
jgi:hypothetical protein